MKTKFHLRKGTKKSTINFEFRNGTQLKFRASTGFVINSEKDWDLNKQKMKLLCSTLNAKLINSKLSEFDNLLNDLLYKENENDIGIEAIKTIFNEVFGFKEATKPKKQNMLFRDDTIKNDNEKDFITYYEWFLIFYAKNNSPYSKRVLTKGTITTLKNSLSNLKKYMKSRNLKTLYFDDINRIFYNDFIIFLNDKNYTKNYVGTVIQKIKTVMGYALDEGMHTNLEFKKSYFSKVSEVINHPYLDLNELKAIEKLEFVDKEMDVARDVFLVGCFTGLRIGDLLSFIKNPNFAIVEGNRFIQLKQSKTAKQVYIPLKSNVKKIMEKYDGNLPDYLHQNIINKHLKSICKRAKITEKYQYTRTEGGVEVIHDEPKFKFISTHTARRSFCTNAFKEGIPVHDIMAISGHKTERIFLDYIKVDLLQNASRIAEHAFFN
ncbi:tyrosine-type recombinase/integrase [uncultured Flavobacterium sp.]|uniref:site-specific integrase n=1 Tax=uncultured Flavobacterium sp. TaxID=165435 RepID=UPI0030EDE800|tara:strand:+ start:823 stop:2127 length:1305 start_codon:yes stop_codon:yes gene_type:complete